MGPNPMQGVIDSMNAGFDEARRRQRDNAAREAAAAEERRRRQQVPGPSVGGYVAPDPGRPTPRPVTPQRQTTADPAATAPPTAGQGRSVSLDLFRDLADTPADVRAGGGRTSGGEVLLPFQPNEDPAVVRIDRYGQPVDADGYVVEYASREAREQAIQEARAARAEAEQAARRNERLFYERAFGAPPPPFAMDPRVADPAEYAQYQARLRAWQDRYITPEGLPRALMEAPLPPAPPPPTPAELEQRRQADAREARYWEFVARTDARFRQQEWDAKLPERIEAMKALDADFKVVADIDEELDRAARGGLRPGLAEELESASDKSMKALLEHLEAQHGVAPPPRPSK